MKFGPGVVNTFRIFFTHHFQWVLIAIAVGLVVVAGFAANGSLLLKPQ